MKMSKALVEGDVHLILFTLLYREPKENGPSRNLSNVTDIGTIIDEDGKDSRWRNSSVDGSTVRT